MMESKDGENLQKSAKIDREKCENCGGGDNSTRINGENLDENDENLDENGENRENSRKLADCACNGAKSPKTFDFSQNSSKSSQSWEKEDLFDDVHRIWYDRCENSARRPIPSLSTPRKSALKTPTAARKSTLGRRKKRPSGIQKTGE